MLCNNFNTDVFSFNKKTICFSNDSKFKHFSRKKNQDVRAFKRRFLLLFIRSSRMTREWPSIFAQIWTTITTFHPTLLPSHIEQLYSNNKNIYENNPMTIQAFRNKSEKKSDGEKVNIVGRWCEWFLSHSRCCCCCCCLCCYDYWHPL